MMIRTSLILLVLAYCAVAQDNDVEVLSTTPASTGKPSKGPNKNNKVVPPPLPAAFVHPEAFLYGDPFFPVVLPLAAPTFRGVVQLKSYSAEGEIEGTSGGTLLLQQVPGGPLLVTGNLTGLPSGRHALAVHALGDLRRGCDSLGPIFDAGLGFHNVPLNGGPPVLIGSAGDLGNVEVDSDGSATIRMLSTVLQLTEPRSVLGRGFIVLEREMDYRTADLGRRIVCGVAGVM